MIEKATIGIAKGVADELLNATEEPIVQKRNSIVIRGYTQDNRYAMELFNTLSEQWSFDVFLNGIQKIFELDYKIYAFEMEVMLE